jgi:predicted nuclease with RNAse H fold
MEFIFVYFNNHEKIIPTRRSNFHRHWKQGVIQEHLIPRYLQKLSNRGRKIKMATSKHGIAVYTIFP